MQTTDNTPLLQAFDADWRNTHPGGHWYNISVAICEADARYFEARRDPRSAAERAADEFAAEVLDTQGSDRP